MTEHFDFIGDVHGHAERLRGLLAKLGYQAKKKTFRHKGRHAVFLGDIINRGPEIKETVQIVRAMVDRGDATLLMGNHELNALQNAVPDPARRPRKVAPDPLDPAMTIQAFEGQSGQWQNTLEWLLQRPFVFEHRGVRAVHACWSDHAAAAMAATPLRASELLVHDGRMHDARLLTEGPSITATPDMTQNGKRLRFRVRWWMCGGQTWNNCGYPLRHQLPETPLPMRVLRFFHPYPVTRRPLFFGHYGFPKPAEPIRPNLACLDLGLTKGHALCAYRWNGERTLRKENFVLA